MEKQVTAAYTLTAVGMIDYMNQVKKYEKDGWKCEGDPTVVGSTIYQTLVKYKTVEDFK
jgi:hypothetical protein